MRDTPSQGVEGTEAEPPAQAGCHSAVPKVWGALPHLQKPGSRRSGGRHGQGRSTGCWQPAPSCCAGVKLAPVSLTVNEALRAGAQQTPDVLWERDSSRGEVPSPWPLVGWLRSTGPHPRWSEQDGVEYETGEAQMLDRCTGPRWAPARLELGGGGGGALSLTCGSSPGGEALIGDGRGGRLVGWGSRR